MEPLLVGTLAILGTSVGLALYRRRLELKVEKVKREVEKLESERAKYLLH